MLFVCIMLELVARLWPRINVANDFAAADHAEQKRPSVSAWRRLLATQLPRKRRPQHLFAIQRMRTGTTLHPYNYCYYCVRCRWTFQVDGRGGVVAVDNQNRPLEGEVAAYRVKTFPKGPCDAHWASSAVIDGGRKEVVEESSKANRKAPLTLVSIRRTAPEERVRSV
jgi:hypothetical protein